MKQDFFSIRINLLDTVEALDICRGILTGTESNSLFFMNAHCFNVAMKDQAYREALNEADLLFNDGIGMKLASKLAGLRFKENMNGTDFIPKVINAAQTLKVGTYLLGAKPGVAAEAANKLNASAGDRVVVGCRDGYFNEDDVDEVIKDIERSGAGLLVIGMGVPIQELWISRHLHRLPGVKLAIAGGAIIDFISGRVQRSPVWMQKIGLEWLFRFGQEPTRLFNRYFVGNFVFFYNVLRQRRR